MQVYRYTRYQINLEQTSYEFLLAPARSGLDGASTANVAFHLHLAVCQGTLVLLGTKDMVSRPMDAVLRSRRIHFLGRPRLDFCHWCNLGVAGCSAYSVSKEPKVAVDCCYPTS